MAAKVVTLGLVVALSILLALMNASVAGRDAALNSFACPRFNPTRAPPVALEELRTHPVRYQGRLVKVRGTYVDGWEMSALHPGPPVRDPWAADGIWVEGIAPMTLPTEQAVEMIGIVSAARPDAVSGKGHPGQWPVELCVSSVRRCRSDWPRGVRALWRRERALTPSTYSASGANPTATLAALAHARGQIPMRSKGL